jgi:hypothetical protein
MSDSQQKQQKLTVEDLVKSQRETEKHLFQIAQCITTLTRATYRRKDGGAGSWWFVFVPFIWLFSNGHPIAQQAFSSFCLLIIAGLLLSRGYGVSAADEFKEDEEAIERREADEKRMRELGMKFKSQIPKS